MAPAKQLPPLDGSVFVLPGFIDFHAEHNPSLPWVLFPSRTGAGPEAISFGAFAQATHRMAHALRPDRQGKDGEIVAVIAHCDTILYLALLAGIVRAGLTVRICYESTCELEGLTQSFLGISYVASQLRPWRSFHAAEDFVPQSHRKPRRIWFGICSSIDTRQGKLSYRTDSAARTAYYLSVFEKYRRTSGGGTVSDQPFFSQA